MKPISCQYLLMTKMKMMTNNCSLSLDFLYLSNKHSVEECVYDVFHFDLRYIYCKIATICAVFFLSDYLLGNAYLWTNLIWTRQKPIAWQGQLDRELLCTYILSRQFSGLLRWFLGTASEPGRHSCIHDCWLGPQHSRVRQSPWMCDQIS